MPANRRKGRQKRRDDNSGRDRYRARIDQLFEEAIRDLESLKRPPRAGRARLTNR